MNFKAVVIAAMEAVGLFVSGFVIPLIGQALMLFSPVPLILAYVRNGRTEGLASLGIAAAIVAVASWQMAAILILGFGLMAIGTAEGMRRGFRPESAALLGGLLPMAALSIVAAYYFVHNGKNPVTAVETYLQASISEAAAIYTKFGLTEMAAAVTAVSDSFIHYLVRLLPGIAIATSVIQAACCYGFSRAIIMRRPEPNPLPSGTTLAAWYAPDAWVWGLIVTLVLVMVPGKAVQITGWNLAILFALLYLTQGIALVEHYLRKARLKAFVRGLIHTIILVLPPVIAGVIAIGVVDIWADFRKVRVHAKQA